MGELFHGWGRKIGIVTLLLACVFVVGSVRSTPRIDAVSLSTGGIKLVIFSGSQHLRLILSGARMIQLVVALKSPDGSEQYTGWIIIAGAPWDTNGFSHRSERARIAEVNSLTPDEFELSLVPYWPIFIPLPLLSEWLLLSKPQKPKQKPVEPTATIGA